MLVEIGVVTIVLKVINSSSLTLPIYSDNKTTFFDRSSMKNYLYDEMMMER